MANANEEYLDAVLRHHIGVRRYSAGLATRIRRLLEEADLELSGFLRDRLTRFVGRDIDFTSDRWNALLTDLRDLRSPVHTQVLATTRTELGQLAVMEAQREITLLTGSIPIEISFSDVPVEKLRAIVSARPFQGRLLKDWYSGIATADQGRLRQAIQLGMVEGEPIDTMVRRVIGTRKNNYTDGIVATTRKDAQTIVRTAVNHVSNTARDYVWEANSDITSARILTATLDGRTSAVCRARDGHGVPVGDKPLPEGVLPLKPAGAQLPFHHNERSIWVAYLDGIGIVGDRPFVRSTKTRQKRDVDFRKIAKETGKPIKQVRAEWAANNIGRVPARTNYQEFLKRQPASFQNDVLGQTKGKLFRDGGLDVDQFVDRAGNELSLDQLARTQPEAFIKAGLDPEGF